VSARFPTDFPAAVIERARCGDLDAFGEIYRRFERPAYTLALRMTADAESAREVLHDAMLHVFERIGQYRAEAPFWGWLRRIVANEALMHLRRTRGLVFETIADDHEAADDTLPAWALADRGRLERALAALPAATRSVLWLFHVEEYTHAEIARMTGKSSSFSKSQVARGTARLRDLLCADEEDASCLIATPVAG
jgi:RNA polymerase sigma-70 factor (ECF subfamily)